jgi:hypothetical protein
MRSHRLRIPGRHAYHEHRARIGLPEHGRSILARRVIRRRPFCVICLEPLRRRAHDLQDGVAVHRRGDLSSSGWRSAGIAMSHRRQQTEARRESVQTSRRRCGLHAVAKTTSRVAASGPRASSPVGLLLVDHGSVVIAEHFVVVEGARARRCRRAPRSCRRSADRRVTPAAGAGRALLLSFSPASPASASRVAGRDLPARCRRAAARARMRSASRRSRARRPRSAPAAPRLRRRGART